MNEFINLILTQGLAVAIVVFLFFCAFYIGYKAIPAFWNWWKEFTAIFLIRWKDTILAMDKMADVAGQIMTRQEATDLANRFLEKSEEKHQLTRSEIKLHIDRTVFPILEELKKNE